MSEIENCCGNFCVKADIIAELKAKDDKIAELQNDVLAQRVAELTSQLSTANSMHVDNDRYKYEQRGFGCVDDLLLHFDALAAQIEQLHNSGEKMALDLVNSTEYHSLRSVKDWAELKDSTPAQCLAEVRATAIEEFGKWLKETDHLSVFQVHPSGLADEYANQIRKAAKAGN